MPQSSSTLQWLSLVGIIWLQSINGTNTNFPAYSSQLKRLLSISQVQLNNLAFASDAGKLLGWFSGVAILYLPLWVVLMIGSALGLIGYGIQFLFLTNHISSLAYWQIFILTVLGGNSICWINTVCYVVTIRNFPFHRQTAVGLSTSYQGLSAMIYTVIVDAFFPSKKTNAYVLLNSILPMMVSMLTAPSFINIETKAAKGIKVGFAIMFVITIVIGIYAVFGSLGIPKGFSPSVQAICLGVLLTTLLVTPVVAKVREVRERKRLIKKERRVYDLSMNDVDVEVGGEREVKDGEVVEENSEVRVREEIGVKLMVRRLECWLYFFVYLFGATLGLVFLNNLGQIAESRGYSKTSSLVSLSSSFGFFGRLMPSIIDYFFSKSKHMVSRTASIVILMVPMAGAFFLLLSPSNISLYISTAIIGVCSGAVTSIAVSITLELFGTENFGVNHNIVVANIPAGSFIFGYFAAILYQKEGGVGNGSCMGYECYKTTFLIWGSICSLGTLLSFILYVRTRKFYSQS